ncbi:MAG: competence/damage-inducible protein A [Myxococcales bacterium]|nr:competence/damage-inducible protein A [Myxococcales bacterium]
MSREDEHETLAPQVAESAAFVLIGNELLSGKVQEENLVELAKLLRALGIRLKRVVMIPDDIDTIAEEVALCSRTHDIVFTSGGVGPTHDDLTLDAVAKAFEVELCLNETMADMLRNAYGERCTEHHLRMARAPEGAVLATTPEERWPTVVMRNVWILPGVPQIFRSKLTVVRTWVRGQEAFCSRAVLTRLDEGNLKPLLDQVVSEHPKVEVGSYPKWFDATYKTKITFDSRDSAAVDAAVLAFVALVPSDGIVRME